MKEEIIHHRDCIKIIHWLTKQKWGTVRKNNSPLDGQKVMLHSRGRKLAIRFRIPFYQDASVRANAGTTFTNLSFKNHITVT